VRVCLTLQYGDPNPPFERKCALDIGEQRDNVLLP
jgi:Cu2+-containing amine oxidase